MSTMHVRALDKRLHTLMFREREREREREKEVENQIELL
jgi:hypothetical protein